MNPPSSLTGILAGCAWNVLAILLVTPLAEGLRRRIAARVQSRIGPPLLQPWFDLLKLLGKEDLETGSLPWAQRAAAVGSPVAMLAVACCLPLGAPVPLGPAGDVLLLVLLLTGCSLSQAMAGLAAGSTYSLLGASRELTLLLTLEPLLAVAVVLGAVRAGSLGLEPALHGSLGTGTGFPGSSAVMLGILLVALPAFAQRSPFDIAEAETEIVGGTLVEYSGPKLALLEFARWSRLPVYSALVAALFLPRPSGWPPVLDGLAFWAAVLALVVWVSIVSALHARFRVDQAFRGCAVLLALALGALALAGAGL